MTEDFNVQQINMFGLSDDQAEPDQDNQLEQDDSEESSNDVVDEISHHQPLDPDTARIHSRIDAYIEAGGALPTVDVRDLLGHTFISEPDEEGEQVLAKSAGLKPQKNQPMMTHSNFTSSNSKSRTRYLRRS
jgi:hypothetical protein